MTHEQPDPQGNETAVHGKAREVARAGKLPNRRPDRSWGGRGAGADCAICGTPVTNDELEFEFEFARSGDDPGRDTYHVHVRCFWAWEANTDREPFLTGSGGDGMMPDRGKTRGS